MSSEQRPQTVRIITAQPLDFLALYDIDLGGMAQKKSFETFKLRGWLFSHVSVAPTTGRTHYVGWLECQAWDPDHVVVVEIE